MYDYQIEDEYEQSTLFLGDSLQYRQAESDLTEDLQDELQYGWRSIPIDPCKICWLSEAPQEGQKDVEPALGYTAYGNQPETAVAYSHAVLLAIVPEFEERERRRLGMGEQSTGHSFVQAGDAKRRGRTLKGMLMKDGNCTCHTSMQSDADGSEDEEEGLAGHYDDGTEVSDNEPYTVVDGMGLL